MRKVVVCNGCGIRFEKLPYLVRKTNYCSVNCYHNSTKRKLTRICIKCQKSFQIKKYLVDKGYGLYCSRKCQHLDYPVKVVVKCEHCGKLISKPPSIAKFTHFCSKRCHDLAISDFEIRICSQCHKEFQIPTWEIKKGKGKFCSWECFIKYKGESSLEEIVRKYFELNNIKFEQEKRFGKYRADFFLPSQYLIVECDGEFWHLKPNSLIRDQKKDRYLTSLGYKILRLKGSEIVNRKSLTNAFAHFRW